MWAAHSLRVRVLEERQAFMERHQGEISALNEQLMKAHEEERMRIAGELHDGILQRITSVSLDWRRRRLRFQPIRNPRRKFAKWRKG